MFVSDTYTVDLLLSEKLQQRSIGKVFSEFVQISEAKATVI